MKPDEQSLQRLLAAARQAPVAGEESAPYGFSTRVAALAFGPQRRSGASFASISLRVAALAGILAALAVVLNFSAIAGAFDDDPAGALATSDDPVAEVVNLGS